MPVDGIAVSDVAVSTPPPRIDLAVACTTRRVLCAARDPRHDLVFQSRDLPRLVAVEQGAAVAQLARDAPAEGHQPPAVHHAQRVRVSARDRRDLASRQTGDRLRDEHLQVDERGGKCASARARE